MKAGCLQPDHSRRSRAARSLGVLALVLLSALLYSLCFPLAHLRLLGWVAIIPFFAALRMVRPRTAPLVGWIWGVSMAYGVGDCLSAAVSTYYDQPLIVGVALSAGVYGLMSAPCYALFAWWYRYVAARSTYGIALLTGAAWVATEWLRARLVSGLPWALFGYSQVGNDRLVQIADLTGVYGVSFLLVAVNAALMGALAPSFSAVRLKRASLDLLLVAGCLTCALIYGETRLRMGIAASGPAVSVAIVQPNLDIGSRWKPELYGRNLAAHLRLTKRAVSRPGVEIVFWPEGSMTFFVQDEPQYRRAIARVLGRGRAELLAGGPRAVGRHNAVYYNSAFLISREGRLVSVYDKEVLLPFAEYFPLAELDFLRRRFARVRTFTSGGAPALLSTRAGPAGITICDEAMFPEVAAKRVRKGAAYLVNLANDTWLGDRKFSEQQFNLVSLRAIEQRRYLVRASTSGPSGVVDPFGRSQTRSEPFSREVLYGHVEPMDVATWYQRLGDLFAWACAAAAVLCQVCVGIFRRHSNGSIGASPSPARGGRVAGSS